MSEYSSHYRHAFSPQVTTAILIALVLCVGAIFLVLLYPHFAYRFSWFTYPLTNPNTGTSWTALVPARLNTRGTAHPWFGPPPPTIRTALTGP